MNKYITVIGLEIHSELLTNSKVFCNCSAEFGGDQNTRVCPVCTGMPGTLPVINHNAVEYAVKAGFALGCDINKFSTWDRKNYFYPDLPKAYQISQLYHPLCVNGSVSIEVDGVKKDVRIHQIHLEEDAGKLIHDDLNKVSLADYNRCGVPLIEIVSEPDLRSAEEAKTYVEQVILLLQYAGVSDCKLEEGSIRCDVNISLMREDATEFGTRAEIKNLNSLKSIVRAIEFEEKRQAALLDAGEKVVQETRRFNDNRGETMSMRSKENAHDYRYFPEPDILQVNFTDEELAEIKGKLPVMPDIRFDKYVNEYKLAVKDAKIIVNSRLVSDFYDEVLAVYNNPKSVTTFVLNELLRRVNLGEVSLEKLPFTAQDFALTVQMSDEEKVSKDDAKLILRYMIETGKKPMDIAKENGFLIEIDTEKVDSVINDVLAENKEIVDQYLGGEVKVFSFLMGKSNKALKGVATPKVVKETLEKKLASLMSEVTTEKTEETEVVSEAFSTENMTLYKNDEKYVPVEKTNYRTLDGTSLITEYTVKHALENVGKVIKFSGCVHKVRNMGSISFIVVRTGRNLVQTVYSASDCKDKIDNIKEGIYINVAGTVVENKNAPDGVEIALSQLTVMSTPKAEYPLKISQGKLNCSIDLNLDYRSVSLRNPLERAVFKLQEGVVQGFTAFMIENNFTQVNTPKIVAQGAEGGANIFHLEYFGKQAFLNQSPQFYKQTCVAFFDRVFEINPVYRAERHATSRHINEYIGLDFEMGFIDSMNDVMNMETAMLKYLMEYLKEHYAYEIEMLGADIPTIENIPSITFVEAMEIVKTNKGGNNKFDLDPEDEVFLCEYAKKNWGSEFVFVTHFPAAKRPFYAMNDREDPRTALSFDLLFRGLEITTGGQRIHDYDELVGKMTDMKMDIEDFLSYLDVFKYGMPPHGGLGIGLERLLMKLLNLTNIRHTSMFPRDINRLLP